MRLRVVCGFGETIATLSPVSLFVNVDFPEFALPTIVIIATLVIIDFFTSLIIA
jgi:hypothetical protein